MVYFDIGKFKNIKGPKRKIVFSALRVGVILALAGAVAAIVLLQRPSSAPKELRKGEQEILTEEEKIRILEGLSAPTGAPQYTDEEKRQILDSLSAPSGQPTLSEEEKKAILESLNVPE